jgi:divalent metal cation (Fe/Co/Zn/Cd) transporter
MTATAPAIDAHRRSRLRARVRLIVSITITYNIVEGLVSIAAGAAASSAALIGFGLDSFVEVLSAVAIAWQFTRTDPERHERATLRVIAIAFFALAAWVSLNALLGLAGVWTAEHSPVGIAIALASVIVMPSLALWERHTGRELGSASVVADSHQTLICAALSLAVLAGLVLNSLFGWAWADPLAAFVIVGFALREGREAWKGDACGTAAAVAWGDREA